MRQIEVLFQSREHSDTPGRQPDFVRETRYELNPPVCKDIYCACISKGIGDRVQIFSTDFIDEDFVDAFAAFTKASADGKA